MSSAFSLCHLSISYNAPESSSHSCLVSVLASIIPKLLAQYPTIPKLLAQYPIVLSCLRRVLSLRKCEKVPFFSSKSSPVLIVNKSPVAGVDRIIQGEEFDLVTSILWYTFS